MKPQQLRSEDGQTSVYVIGVTVIVLLFALTIAAIMSVTLQHRKLLALADSAAQRAATAFTLDDPNELSLSVTPQTAHDQVAQHLVEVDAPERFTNLSVESITVSADTTVTVVLSATAHPPVVNWVVPAGVSVTAESTARTRLTP